MADPHEAKPGEPTDTALPFVDSPKLDGSQPEVPHAVEAAEPKTDAPLAASSAEAPPLPRSLRCTLLAASVAVAAALGSFAGSLSASGVAHLWPAAAAGPSTVANLPSGGKAELAELSALKEGAARSQFAKLADRLDRIEHAEAEAATKVAHIAEAAVDRLEKKNSMAAASAVPETTGSIASNQPAASNDTRPSDRVLPDWIVQDVHDGRALVENRYGGVFDVAAGSILPGLGRIETIKRQGGRWIVVTARGLISSAP